MNESIVSMQHICKSFPGVKALDDVSFELRAGEVMALLGENGAGKSTLMKILSGVYTRDSGTLELFGNEYGDLSPKQAQQLGVAIIHQELNMCPHLSVAENMFLGREVMKGFMVDKRAMESEAKRYLDDLRIDIDPGETVGNLPVSKQQMVEIAKALSLKARIIIMDEPTAALTKRESEELYRITRKLRDEGKSIIFISHRFEDMYALASRVTVFRDARYIGTYDVNSITNADLITAMVGREIKDLFPKPEVEIAEEVLRVERLSRTGYFRDVSFSVHRGEILGLTGLVGARRTEVVQTIFGAEDLTSGKIYLNGKQVRIKSPSEAMKLGIGLLPENRQIEGLILDWGIGQNITLTELNRFVHGLFINEKQENTSAKTLAEEVDTKAVSVFDKASSLSGGNQQKVVVAKALGSDFKVLILDEPTKGVDVGAKAAIYEIMGQLAQQGYAIIMISSEMPEILGMCDRIVVMCEGRVTGELLRQDATQEKILELAMSKQTAAEGSV